MLTRKPFSDINQVWAFKGFIVEVPGVVREIKKNEKNFYLEKKKFFKLWVSSANLFQPFSHGVFIFLFKMHLQTKGIREKKRKNYV